VCDQRIAYSTTLAGTIVSSYFDIQRQIEIAKKNSEAAAVILMDASEPTDEMRASFYRHYQEEIQLSGKLRDALAGEAKEFAASTSLEQVSVLYRGRRYYVDGRWYVYYEPCKILGKTSRYIIVSSQDFEIPGFYRGGKFHVNRDELRRRGIAYHSRHGDNFYIKPLSDSSPLPSSAVIGGVSQPKSNDLVLGSPHRK
jgi:hypothetical protein